MEAFRKVIKGWLGKVLLVLFLTPLALVGIEGYFSGGKTADTAQLVNGESISKKELEGLTNSFKEQYLAYVNGDETLLNQKFIENKALDTLTSRTLLLQQAKNLGISLSDAQIEQMIAQQPNFQVDGKFSETMYANYLKSVGMTSQALVQNLRQDHALKMLSTSFLDHALVSQKDLLQIANLQTEQRTLHVARMNLDEFKNKVTVTEQEIQAYYDKHSHQFKQVTNVDVDYVVLSAAQLPKTNVEITEAELQQAYEKFVQAQQANAAVQVKHILITTDARTDAQAKQLAETAQAELKQGASFAATAQKYSEDPDSKAKAGLVEGYAAGVFGETFDQAVAGLKAGQTSAPVKTQYGYHLIQTVASAVNVPSFAQEKARLQAELAQSKSANLFSDTVNSLNELVVGSDALDVVTQEVATAKVQSVNGMTLATVHPVLSDPSVKTKLFNTDVQNGDRNASSNIQLANGDVVWVKVRNYHAAGVQTLAEAAPRVKAQVIDQKAFDAAQASIQSTLNQFNAEPAAQVLAKTTLKFVNAGDVVRSQSGLIRELERAAFSVLPPKSGHWSVKTVQQPNELVVVGVSAVKQNAQALPAEALAQLRPLYQQLRGEQELDDYTRYLKAQAKIK